MPLTDTARLPARKRQENRVRGREGGGEQEGGKDLKKTRETSGEKTISGGAIFQK